MVTPQLLIVDDESSLLEFLDLLFQGEGYRVATASSVGAARERLAVGDGFDLVMCDIHMPDGSGLELLRELKEQHSQASVIMMTAYTSTKSAIEAMRLGAYDYVSKPFDVEELKVLVQKALEKSRLVEENVWLRRELEQKYTFANIIGKSRPMQEVFALVERVARTSSTVLVQGDSGTGKELIARAIHFASPRTKHKFLSINCGAMPENLLESELFGHERGAFTGALKEKKGLFHEAHRGTLFLDEIGEMTPTMQVKLLRVLQHKTIRKVGGNEEEAVDVRIIAATNRDLGEMIAAGTFREDLYYRIHVIPVRLPPLRDRREDIPLLVDFFIRKYADELGMPPKRISLAALALLEGYRWPGNVRELENLIERSIALTTGDVIDVADLPPYLREPGPSMGALARLPADGIDLEAHLEALRAELMRQALDRCGGVQTRAAELLGMTFRSFRYYAKKAGIVGALEEEVEA
ncbi:MAG TPA: sigma-54 dependent transcriptional regulator [Thermoanaerobaculia bacterium]|jgi:two-component system response regulator PilR (NtrC family)|nr:sigma-54 dependent transcriptional regulator [Thermoanaerobaculia bacterium]